MPNDKKTGDTQLPETERDLPLQGGSEDGAQARHQKGGRDQGVRKAGIVRESEDAERADKPDQPGQPDGQRADRASKP